MASLSLWSVGLQHRFTVGKERRPIWTSPFRPLRATSRLQIVEGLTVVVADPDDVLRSKEAAGRDKDLMTLPQIRRDFIDAGVLDAGDARGPVAAPISMGPGAPPSFLSKLLGTRPEPELEQRTWDVTAQLVLDYRQRWSISEPDEALGTATPIDPVQRADRVKVAKIADSVRRRLQRK
jgi:hypothetical protein